MVRVVAFIFISSIYAWDTLVGYRLLNLRDNKVVNAKKTDVESKLANQSVDIVNLSYESGEVRGTNGAISRYPKCSLDGKLIGDSSLSPLIVLGRVGDEGFKVCNYLGNIKFVPKSAAIAYALKAGIANGKVVDKYGKKELSSIFGNYPLVEKPNSSAETNTEQPINPDNLSQVAEKNSKEQRLYDWLKLYHREMPKHLPSGIGKMYGIYIVQDKNTLDNIIKTGDIADSLKEYQSDYNWFVSLLLELSNESGIDKDKACGVLGEWEYNQIVDMLSNNILLPSIVYICTLKFKLGLPKNLSTVYNVDTQDIDYMLSILNTYSFKPGLVGTSTFLFNNNNSIANFYETKLICYALRFQHTAKNRIQQILLSHSCSDEVVSILRTPSKREKFLDYIGGDRYEKQDLLDILIYILLISTDVEEAVIDTLSKHSDENCGGIDKIVKYYADKQLVLEINIAIQKLIEFALQTDNTYDKTLGQLFNSLDKEKITGEQPEVLGLDSLYGESNTAQIQEDTDGDIFNKLEESLNPNNILSKPNEYTLEDWVKYLLRVNKGLYDEKDTSIFITKDILKRRVNLDKLSWKQKYRVNDAVAKLEKIQFKRVTGRDKTDEDN